MPAIAKRVANVEGMPLERAEMETIDAPASNHIRSGLPSPTPGTEINTPAMHAAVTNDCQTTTEGPATRGDRNGSARSPAETISTSFAFGSNLRRPTLHGVIYSVGTTSD